MQNGSAGHAAGPNHALPDLTLAGVQVIFHGVHRGCLLMCSQCAVTAVLPHPTIQRNAEFLHSYDVHRTIACDMTCHMSALKVPKGLLVTSQLSCWLQAAYNAGLTPSQLVRQLHPAWVAARAAFITLAPLEELLQRARWGCMCTTQPATA